MPEDQNKLPGKVRDSFGNTLLVAISVSLVCSLLVASTAVLLKPKQAENEERYRQAIVLDVAGLLAPGADVAALFADIETRIVKLADGSYADSIDARIDVSNRETDVAIPEALDVAQIHRRASHALVYIVRTNGVIEQIILPVYGPGLWSSMHGYLAVAGDGATIRGLRFYEHAETPGLGDQIDDAQWRALWSGKQIYDQDGLPRIEVIRGFVQPGADAPYQIDGISGATFTGRGVTNLIRYWTGPHGFGPYLGKIQEDFNGNE